jgi:hypothetical protein
MRRCLLLVTVVALQGHGGIAAAQTAGGSDTFVAGPDRSHAATGCTNIRRDASRNASSLEVRLKEADANTRRDILLRLLMSADAAALFSCLPQRGTAD